MLIFLRTKVPFFIFIVFTSSLFLPVAEGASGEEAKAFWVSQPLKPNETAMVSTGNINADALVEVSRVPDSELRLALQKHAPALLRWEPVKPFQTSTTSIKFLVPEKFRQGLFAYRIVSGGTKSKIYYINKPDIWFIQGDQGRAATPGGTIQVVGTALALPEGISRERPAIALVDSDGNATTVSADVGWNANFKTAGYAQLFTLPSYLALGNYTVYYSNGYGGSDGWAKAEMFRPPVTPITTIGNPSYSVPTNTISIIAAQTSSTTVMMAAPVTSGTDDANFTLALSKLEETSGGVLSIPTGVYVLTQPLIIPANVILKGSGKQKTVLNWSVEPTYSAGNAAALISGRKTLIQNYWGWDKFSVQDLAITTTAPHVGSVITIAQNHAGNLVFIRNVSISTPGGSTAATSTFGINIAQTENVTIANTDINATSALQLSNSQFINVQGCTFNYTHSSIDVVSSDNVYVNNNHFTVTKGFIFDGGDYGITVTGETLSAHMFFGANIIDRNGVPDTTLGMMTFDNNNGAFFGSGVVANGTMLTLPHAVTGSMAVAMIFSGTGAGQWRWVLGGVGSATTQVTLDRAWDIPPDTNSVISLVGMLGRVIFAGNTYLQQAGFNNAYYMTTDVIQANNDMTSDAPQMYAGQRANFAVVPGWHYQVLGNHTHASTNPATTQAVYGSYAQVLSPANSFYTQPVLGFQVYRDNYFDAGVPGLLQIGANTGSSITDMLIENNQLPAISFTATVAPNTTILDTMLRGNTSSMGTQPVSVTITPASMASTIQRF
jgi:hypothetical protein